MVRAKFKLTKITQDSYNQTARTFQFDAQYDAKIPEDQRFFNSTPSGTFTMLVNNPKAIEQMELGKQYYFDITPANDQ